MKTILRILVLVIMASWIGVTGCQLIDKEIASPTIQATGEIAVGVMGAQGPILTITQAEASGYLSIASGLENVTFSDISIISDADGNLFLKGYSWDENEPNSNSIATSILVEENGGTIYLRATWKKCKGNDCSSCDFNETQTDCKCSDTSPTAKCDYSEGVINSWSNY